MCTRESPEGDKPRDNAPGPFMWLVVTESATAFFLCMRQDCFPLDTPKFINSSPFPHFYTVTTQLHRLIKTSHKMKPSQNETLWSST